MWDSSRVVRHLVSDKDLALLYQKAKKDSGIFLWIEPINEESDDDNHSGRKKRRKNKEDEIVKN